MHADMEYNINQDGRSMDALLTRSNETIRVAIRQSFLIDFMRDFLVPRPRRGTRSRQHQAHQFRVVSSEIGKIIVFLVSVSRVRTIIQMAIVSSSCIESMNFHDHFRGQ